MRLTTVVCAVLLSLGCRSEGKVEGRPKTHPEVLRNVRVGEFEIIVDNAPPARIDDVPVPQYADYIERSHRVLPDRRFLYAVGQIHHLITGASPSSIHLTAVPSGWVISYANLEVGTVPATPNFSQLIELLRKWGGRMERPKSASAAQVDLAAIAAEIETFAPAHLLAALANLDDSWNGGQRDETASLAARAAIFLQLQSFDAFEMGDSFAGQTLALFALSCGRGECPAGEETLLASSLGYENDAVKASNRLPSSHPARLYVRRQLPDLERVVAADSNAIRPLYLYMRLRTERDGSTKAFEWLARNVRQTSPAVLRALMANPEFEDAIGLASLDQAALLHSLHGSKVPDLVVSLSSDTSLDDAVAPLFDQVARASDFRRQTRIRSFESMLDASQKTATGRLLTESNFRSYASANFYNAVYEEGHFYLDSLSSIPAAEEFVKGLGQPSLIEGREVKRWFALRTSQKKRDDVIADLTRNLNEVSAVSTRLMVPMFEEEIDRLDNEDPSKRPIARLLLQRLDARPLHLLEAGDVLFRHLDDVKRSHKLLGAAATMAPSVDTTRLIWFYRITSDEKALLRLIDRKDLSVEGRGYALKNGLANIEGTDPQFIKNRFRALSQEDPSLIFSWVRYLESQKDFETVREVATSWLEKNQDETPLARAQAAIFLATAHRRLGQPGKAWTTIEPYISTWKEDVFEEASMTSLALGRDDQAMDLAEKAIDRYPSSAWSYAAKAHIFWKQGKYAEASKVAGEARERSSVRSWYDAFGLAFRDAFPTVDDRARAALQAVRESKLDHYYLSNLVAKYDGLDLFKMRELIAGWPEYSYEKNPSMAQRLHFDAAEALEKAKGVEAAADWFIKTCPDKLLPQLIPSFYQERQWHLIRAFEDRAYQYKSAQTDLFITAAMLHGKERGSERWNRMLQRWKAQPSNTYFSSAIRYLLGVESEETFLSFLSKPGNYPEAYSYFIALRRASDGNFDEAADILQASLDVRSKEPFPRRWAMSELYYWEGLRKPFAKIAVDRNL